MKNMESKLSVLDCPFTWNMDDVKIDEENRLDDDDDTNLHDEEELIPLFKLMRVIMSVYEAIKADQRSEEILMENLEKCDQIIKTLQKE